MNKQISSIFLCLSGLLFVGQAFAGTGWYTGLEGGVSLPNNSHTDASTPISSSSASSSGFLTIPGLATLFPSASSSSSSGQQNLHFNSQYNLGYAVGGTLGYEFKSGLRPELEVRYQDNGFDKLKTSSGSTNAKGDLGVLAVMGNLWYDIPLSKHIQPYLGGGAGYARVSLNDFRTPGTSGTNGTDTVFAWQVGAGLDFPLTKRITASIGYRYFVTKDPHFRDNNTNIHTQYTTQIAQLGLRYTFAGPGHQAADSDHDGVPNSKDQCPNTPKGVAVNAKGCALDSDHDGVPNYKDQCPDTPKGVAVNAKGCALDSDHDGVPNYKDQCPNTPAGTQVNAKGCPLHKDSDHDGVPNSRDKCPNTPKGAKVLANGCAVNQKYNLRGVTFHFNKATLTPNAKRVLDYVAKTLKASPGFQVELDGYTDSVGPQTYNLKLSRRRAAAAKQYLVSKGVAAKRITTKGFGEKHPMATNKTAKGRRLNRRIELKVTGYKGKQNQKASGS